MKRDSNGRFCKENKYEVGSFGHWWTVVKGNSDIKGKVYNGFIDCSNYDLTSLDGSPKEVGGDFVCIYNQLTSLIGAPEYVGGWFVCSYNQLTSLDGAPEYVGRSFYCNGNQLTTLVGAPKYVGGSFDCYNNPELTTLPDDLNCNRIFGDVYKWKGSVWSFFDDVKKEVRKVKHTKSLTVYEMVDGTFCVYDGEFYSHGETLKQAKNDLIYKRTSRDLTEYEKYTLDTVVSKDDAVKMYRSITGACEFGTKEFCSNIKTKSKYTIKEIINITNGQYGSDKLKKFFVK